MSRRRSRSKVGRQFTSSKARVRKLETAPQSVTSLCRVPNAFGFQSVNDFCIVI